MITAMEILYLLVMTQSIMVHVVILPLAYHVVGRDAWISAFLSVPVGMIVIWSIYRLKLSFSTGMDDYVAKSAGKTVLVLVKIIFSVYFLFLASFSAASLLDMVKAAFLTLTPLWALTVGFMLASLYIAIKSYKNIAMVAGVLAYVSVLSGILIATFDASEKKWGNIFPIMENGWQPVGNGAVMLCSIWAEMLFLLFIPVDRRKETKKWIIRACYGGVAINGITMILTLAGTVMVFGLGQTRNLNYPSLEIVRFLTLGFVDRFDVYGEILMIFGVFIRSSLYMRIACDQIFRVSRPAASLAAILCTAVAVAAASMLMSQSHFAFVQSVNYYTYGGFLLPLPFLLYGVGILAKKRAAGKKAGG